MDMISTCLLIQLLIARVNINQKVFFIRLGKLTSHLTISANSVFYYIESQKWNKLYLLAATKKRQIESQSATFVPIFSLLIRHLYVHAAARAITLLSIRTCVLCFILFSCPVRFFRLRRKSMVYNFARWPTCKSRVSNHLMHVFFLFFTAALDRNVKFAQSC